MARDADFIRVLLVDDGPEVAESTATHLSREDERMTVETAPSTTTALERLADGAIDCVVSGHDVPDLDGVGFLRAVREKHDWLPFILFTGAGSEEVASDAITAGVTDYLPKRTGTEQYAVLADRVRTAVEAYRDQRETELSARHLRRCYQRITDGFFAIDRDWRYTFVNEEGARLVGKSSQEMVGARIWDVFPELEGTAFAEAFRTAMASQEATSVEERYPPCEAWFDVRVYPDEEGISIYFRNVTDREESRRELEETTRQLDAVLNTVDSAIFMKDTDGRYLHFNQKAREVLGIESDTTVVGKTDYELFPNEFADQYRADDQRVFEAGETIRVEEPVPTPNGTRTHLTLKSPVLDQTGEPCAVCAISTDISDRMEREHELEAQRDRLEKFAKVVSHDLRNPLNVALARIELIREECPSDHLEEARKALERMDVLIEDLLRNAKSEREVNDETVDLGAMARRCWDGMDTEDASLVVETGTHARANPNSLRQLLENLFRNAVDHGGRTVTVTIGGLEDGFYVEDDGPGIAPALRDDVFEFGYSRNEGGTGYGLSIVSTIAETQGWGLQVTDGTHGGARFEIDGVELLD